MLLNPICKVPSFELALNNSMQHQRFPEKRYNSFERNKLVSISTTYQHKQSIIVSY